MLRSVDMIPPESGPAEAEVEEEEEEAKEEGPRRAVVVLEERIAIEGFLIFPLGLGPTIEQRDAEEMQARIE